MLTYSIPNIRIFSFNLLNKSFKKYDIHLYILANLFLRRFRLFNKLRLSFQIPVSINSNLINNQRFLNNKPCHRAITIHIISDCLYKLKQYGFEYLFTYSWDDLGCVVTDQFHGTMGLVFLTVEQTVCCELFGKYV